MRKQKAITLISLVITIVILIILSSIAIYLSLGNNGIFVRSKQAKEATNKQTATDIINLKITTAQMNKYAEKQEMPTLQELADILYEDNEIEYIALETKVGAKEKITVGEKTSIFTKLNQYPYEFEINSSLQLASINGVKIAKDNNATSLMPKLLWQNPDPENIDGFEAQTVSLLENNCDIFEIYYLYATKDKSILSGKIICNETYATRLFGVAPSQTATQGTICGCREVFFVNNNSIKFANAYTARTTIASYKDNQYIIPLYIIGYNYNLFNNEQ